MDRKVKRYIRKDLRHFNDKLVQVALEGNKSLKLVLRGTDKGRSTITKIKDHSGTIHTDKDKVLTICTDFYKNLYSAENTGALSSSQIHNRVCLSQQSPQILPQITGSEVHCALRSLKYNRSPGEDSISTEALKIGERTLLPHITNLFNTILETGSFPSQFCHSTITLIHKKGTNRKSVTIVL